MSASQEIRSLLSTISILTSEILNSARFDLGEHLHKAQLLALKTGDDELVDTLDMFEQETRKIIEHTYHPQDREEALHRQAGHLIKAAKLCSEMSVTA